MRRRSDQVIISVLDPAPGSRRVFQAVLTRAQLHDLADAASAGHSVLNAQQARRAQRAVHAIDNVVAMAEPQRGRRA